MNIVLNLCSESFGFDDYLNAERMGNELVKQLVNLIEKSYECNSLEHKLAEFTLKLIRSNLYQEIIYNSICSKDGLYDIELIRSILRITCNIIELVPLHVDRITKVRDKLELVVLHKIQDVDLANEFTERLKPIEDEALNKTLI